ncbi:transposase domain-containing protein [Streptomyces sp. NPDC046751]|uniref:transposase domain-containing protein n=1 Tax=unclassified Streptomyces TaxID=2593676 RepID=UPI0033FC8E19
MSLQDIRTTGAPLLEQAAIARTVGVAAGVFAPGHIGELTQTVPFEMVDEVLEQTGAVQRRVRLVPARVRSTCCWPRHSSTGWAISRFSTGYAPGWRAWHRSGPVAALFARPAGGWGRHR